MSADNRYSPEGIEEKWYNHWMEKRYFNSSPDEREPYSIVIPPPNVTGVLHMGHMLNNTIQDILIRKARLEGKNACWVPGTDHASIATEAKVVKMLAEKGIKKSDITREEFLKYAFEWKDKYGGIILDQLKKLGCSCDWDRTRFTMEDKLSKAVVKVFVDLYKKGKIYQGYRMTNWDPEAKTALSNEEVIYTEENGRLFFVKYQVEGTDEWVTIATTRPETILGDTAVAVNPNDERYTHLHGKKVIIPMVNRVVPIIQDDYVEVEFGTGCLKVTPAHDMNDYEIGKRHKLETIDILNEDGTLSEAAQFYVGEDRFAVRKKIVKELEAKGHIVEIKDYRNKVGRSERTKAIIEPRLTHQWFLEMKDMAATALKAVESGDVTFYPERFFNMYNSWLKEENVRDWCVSRQLWWGQRIPAYFYKDEIFVEETKEAALMAARKKFNDASISMNDLRQEEDVVDTWFSSWLWPISVFDGFEDPTELKYYYPTNTLVTGWDIIFFWVARMVMAGYEWSGDLLGEDLVKQKGIHPFKDVYFTGMVRDKNRKKMSKSLGNSPDALELIDKYGADGVRYGMMSSGAAGNDIVFDAPYDAKTKTTKSESELCAQGMKFCNKMWQGLAYLKGLEVKDGVASAETLAVNQLAAKWFENKYKQVVVELEEQFKTYRLSEALINIYSFIWNDFFSWYLEIVKPAYQQPIERQTYETTLGFFEQLMTLLHPFMPFVTEEIWHQLKERADGDDCVVSKYPKVESYDETLVKNVEIGMDIISKVRNAREANGIKKIEPLNLFIQDTASSKALHSIGGLNDMVTKMAYLKSLTFTDKEVDNTISFIAGTDNYYLELNKTIDTAAEKKKMEEDLEYNKGFVAKVQKKLENKRFVDNAPAEVVEKEKQKLADGLAKIKILEEQLAKLS